VLLRRHEGSTDLTADLRLPDDHGEAYYRVKRSQEAHGRVVKESLLRGLKIS